MNRKRRVGLQVALLSVLAILALSGISCPTTADAITGASLVSASGGTVGFAQMTWSWTYAGTSGSVRPTTIDVTIFRDGSNVMPSETPKTITGTITQDQFIIFRLFSGTYIIRFECTYPPGTLPETATYEFTESI